MKTKTFLSTLVTCLALLGSTVLFSFSKGGDTLEVYLNGKQLLQQNIHMDKSVKTVQLSTLSDKDKVEVYYSHCGYAGKNRTLTVKDEKDNLLKEFKFVDVNTGRGAMSFILKDVKNTGITKLKLYYSSKEMPGSKLLTILSLNNQHTAMR
jgi:hypothetical protein